MNLPGCQLVAKLKTALHELKSQYPSIVAFREIVIVFSDNFFWRLVSGDPRAYVCCGFLRKSTFGALKIELVRMYFESGLNITDRIFDKNISGLDPEEDDENYFYEEREYDSSNRVISYGYHSAFDVAVNRLKSIREVGYPIEIIESDEINGYAKDGKILVTSAACENLSSAELAFIISHEEAHLKREHRKGKKEYADVVASTINDIIKDKKKGFFIRLTSAAAAGVIGTAGSIAVSKACEFDADVEAGKQMREAGYSEEEITRFVDNRTHQSGSIVSTHPSYLNRSRMIKK